MPKYRIPVTRDVSENTVIEVEADSREQAITLALYRADTGCLPNGAHSPVKWEAGDHAGDAYVPDEDDIEEVPQ